MFGLENKDERKLVCCCDFVEAPTSSGSEENRRVGHVFVSAMFSNKKFTKIVKPDAFSSLFFLIFQSASLFLILVAISFSLWLISAHHHPTPSLTELMISPSLESLVLYLSRLSISPCHFCYYVHEWRWRRNKPISLLFFQICLFSLYIDPCMRLCEDDCVCVTSVSYIRISCEVLCVWSLYLCV